MKRQTTILALAFCSAPLAVSAATTLRGFQAGFQNMHTGWLIVLRR